MKKQSIEELIKQLPKYLKTDDLGDGSGPFNLTIEWWNGWMVYYQGLGVYGKVLADCVDGNGYITKSRSLNKALRDAHTLLKKYKKI